MATAGVYTLGCRVNQYESEALTEKLALKGVEVRDFSDKNDIYIINTCTVTAESDRKSRQIIRRALTQNPNAYVIVTGCMAENDRERLLSMKGVDIICGNAAKMSAVDSAVLMLQRGEKNSAPLILDDTFLAEENDFERMRISAFGRTRAYIKIQDGCGGKCSYCIIPTVRGKPRSRSSDDIIEEIKRLSDTGCKEVVLTGIETSDYEFGLSDLAEKISGISGIERIRFGSLDPSFMTENNVSALMSVPKCMPHFHISAQHGSDRVLHRMRRRYDSERLRESIESVRKHDCDAMITVDLIAGFPGEEESDVELSARFIKESRLLHSHIFTYSKRECTPAAVMPGQIPEEEKSRRAAYLESVQEIVKKELMDERIGREYEVLVETVKDGLARGHSRNFIDIAAKTDSIVSKNEIRIVKTDGTDKNGLTGRMI